MQVVRLPGANCLVPVVLPEVAALVATGTVAGQAAAAGMSAAFVAAAPEQVAAYRSAAVAARAAGN